MRVFVAIDLPGVLKEKIFKISLQIGKKIPLRLVAKENLHLTLVFLGNRTEEEVGRIKEAVAKTTGGFGNFFLTVENLEFFPAKRPRGIWFKIGGQIDKLSNFHKKIIDSLLRNGIKVEDLRFTPHTCIGRFRSGKEWREARSKIEKISLGENFMADKVTVFESKLSPKGPSYFKLGEYELY